MRTAIMLVAAAVMLAGCEPRIDAKSPEAFGKSIEAVTKDLSAEDKAAFKEAVTAITFDTFDLKAVGAFTPDVGSPLFYAAAHEKLKGKTAKDVIKLGYETRIKKADEELAKRMAAVQQAKAEREKHKSTFNAVIISSPKFYVRRDFIEEPIIAFDVKNGTSTTIRHGYFHGKLSSPGREIPWVDEDFSYEFVGGLEPGEVKHLELSPNMFGEWGNRDFNRRQDLQLAVALVNIENAQGEKLLTGDPQDTADQEREMLAIQKEKAAIQAKLAAFSRR